MQFRAKVLVNYDFNRLIRESSPLKDKASPFTPLTNPNQSRRKICFRLQTGPLSYLVTYPKQLRILLANNEGIQAVRGS